MADISKVRQLAAAEADKPSRTTAALRAIAHEKAEVTTKKGTAKTPPRAVPILLVAWPGNKRV